MIKISIIFTLVFVLIQNCFALSSGDVVVENINQQILNTQDILQFQLITNGDGLVTSSTLNTTSPNNMETFSKWRFSDQTRQFVVYLRNVSQHQRSFIPCTSTIFYNTEQIPLWIKGWSDGKNAYCQLSH